MAGAERAAEAAAEASGQMDRRGQLQSQGLGSVGRPWSCPSHLTFVSSPVGRGGAGLGRGLAPAGGSPALCFRGQLLLDGTPAACRGTWAHQVLVGAPGAQLRAPPLPPVTRCSLPRRQTHCFAFWGERYCIPVVQNASA